jgi:hypothetical protein
MPCRCSGFVPSDKISAMFPSLRHFVGWVVIAFRSRQDLILENLALRQQLLALQSDRAVACRLDRNFSGSL